MASDPYIGFNMRGYNTNIPQERGIKTPMPSTYYESSFRAFSLAKLDFVRYLFTWESYERDPVAFMNETESMAKAADKWGIKVIYTNDQFRTSSWLDPQKGYGFPASLFQAGKYVRGSGVQSNQTAQQWWTDWYNRTVTNNNGTDGWTSQAQFLKKIVSLADSHKSTLGYELLNEPRLFSQDQWDKVGKYNSYLTDELRKVTKKLIVYDRQASPDLDGPVGITPENMAKMVPSNKENVIFKATLFGLPEPGTIFEQRMNYYVKAAKIAGIPLCFCEYSIKQYTKEPTDYLNQQNVNYFFQTFKNLKLWGWALWVWDFKPRANPNFVFVDFSNNGSMQTNANFDYILNAMGVDTANVTETIMNQPEIAVSAPANETANATETIMTQPETVSVPANETQTKNDSSASASVAQSGKINEVVLANLNIDHSGGDFGSLQTDNISKWITSGKWNLVSTPSNSSQQNSSNIVFNATIDMRTIDNFAEHSHKLSEFKVMNSSIVNINKGINKGIIVTLQGTATLSTDSGNHTDVPIRVKIKDSHPMSINAQNGVTEYSWIPRGGVIALSIDPGKIEDHFGNTPIYGNVKKEKGNQ